MKISLAKMCKEIALTLVFGVMLTASTHAMSSNVQPQLSWGDAAPPVMCSKPVVAPFDYTVDAQNLGPILSIDVLIGKDPWLNGLAITYQNKTLSTLTEDRVTQIAGTAAFTADDPLVEVYGKATSSSFSNVIAEINFKSLSGKVFGPFCQKGGAKGPLEPFSLRGAPNTSIIGFKGVNKNNEYGTWKVGMLGIITNPPSAATAASSSTPSLPTATPPAPSTATPSSSPAPSPMTPAPATPAPQVSVPQSMQADVTAFFNAINTSDWITVKSILGKYASNTDSMTILLMAQQPVTNEKISGVMTTPLHVAASKNSSYIFSRITNSAFRISRAFLKNLVLQRDGANKQPIDYAISNSTIATYLSNQMNS